MRITVLSLLLLCFVSSSAISPGRREVITDSLWHELPAKSSAKDSIRIFYDIYDVADFDDKPGALISLFETARSSGDTESMLDAASMYAQFRDIDGEVMRDMRLTVEAQPKGRRRDEILLFMDLERHLRDSYRMTDDQRYNELVRVLADEDKDYISVPDSDLQQIHKLLRAVIYHASAYETDFINGCLDRLPALMKGVSLPLLLNFYYQQAAQAYTLTLKHDKAVELDRLLLDSEKTQQDVARGKGHRYRAYDMTAFKSSRRMLLNYPALSGAEIDSLHNAVHRLAAQDRRIARELAADDRPHAYYLIATGQYSEAIPHIRAMLKKDQYTVLSKIRMIELLKEAIARTGSPLATGLELEREYTRLLEQYNRENSSQQHRDLEIQHGIYALKADKQAIERQQQEDNLRFARVMMISLIVIAVILAVTLAVITVSCRRSARTAKSLESTVAKLREKDASLSETLERLTLERNLAETADRQRDEFIHFMSHELRTPLNAILGFSTQIMRKLPTITAEKLGMFTDQIAKNTARLQQIIDQYLQSKKA